MLPAQFLDRDAGLSVFYGQERLLRMPFLRRAPFGRSQHSHTSSPMVEFSAGKKDIRHVCNQLCGQTAEFAPAGVQRYALVM